jgi:hypothetical protein
LTVTLTEEIVLKPLVSVNVTWKLYVPAAENVAVVFCAALVRYGVLSPSLLLRIAFIRLAIAVRGSWTEE